MSNELHAGGRGTALGDFVHFHQAYQFEPAASLGIVEQPNSILSILRK